MIRSYLDRETAQIDELIVKQKKLIEVLRERFFCGARSGLCHSGRSGHRLKTVLAELTSGGTSWAAVAPPVSFDRQWRLSAVGGLGSSGIRDLSHYKGGRADDIVVNRMRAFQGRLVWPAGWHRQS